MEKYKSDIIELTKNGMKPKAIAQAICAKHGLAVGSVTPKQVSDKKAKMIKDGDMVKSPIPKKRRKMLVNTRSSRKACKLCAIF
jgi:hypothetical protein